MYRSINIVFIIMFVNDIFQVVFNNLFIHDIYKLKLLNHDFNNFIENEFTLINYYGKKLNKNIIVKHSPNLIRIVIHGYCEIANYIDDNDLMYLNKLEVLKLPCNDKITKEGKKCLSNIKKINLHCWKYLPSGRCYYSRIGEPIHLEIKYTKQTFDSNSHTF